MKERMLTTKDNPFDPFSDYESWFAWDYEHGYHTPGYLARITRFSFDLSENQQIEAIDDAIDEIISMDFDGIYKVVTKNSE